MRATCANTDPASVPAGQPLLVAALERVGNVGWRVEARTSGLEERAGEPGRPNGRLPRQARPRQGGPSAGKSAHDRSGQTPSEGQDAPRSRDLHRWCRGRLDRSVAWKGVDDMTVHNMLQSPERDVLLVSALISIIVVLAFTDWGILAYVLTGLVFAALFLASAIANARAAGATRR